MEPRVLFALSVLAYAGIALLIALWPPRYRYLMFYAYLASVLTLGGILGAVYVLPLGGDVSLLAGQVSYGGFMFSTLVAVVVGRDVQVVRNILVLVATINALILAIFRISQYAVEDGDAANVFSNSAVVFDKSVDSVLLGGVLIMVELLLVLVVLERAKARFGSRSMIPIYLAAYVGALTLDGVLFPVVVLRPDSGLGGVIQDQVLSKLVLAGAFAIPLLVFVLCYRPTIRQFEGADLHLRRLLHVTRDELIERIDEQQSVLDAQRERIVRSTQDAVQATATVSSILDAATDTLLAATDADLIVTAFNAGAERILGVSREEVIGHSPTMFLDRAELARQAADLGVEPDFRAVLEAHVAAGERRDWELNVGDDDRLMVSFSITEIRVDGQLLGYVAAGVDVTERFETEAALQSALEIEQGSLARLRETDELKRAVVSTVSHELRTPIASILGYTELMVEGDFGELSPEQRVAVDRVRSNASRLTRIVDDLLTLDRAEHLPLHLEREPLELGDVVTSYLDEVDELLASRGHELVVDLPDRPVRVLGDLTGLHRVLDNLVGNAVKFTPDPGQVTLRVHVDDADPTLGLLTVVDTGIGISEDDRERLFDRFFRAEEAAAKAIPGSGLGLAIAQAIVEGHGGRIEISSTLGQGTAVTVVLPIAPAP